MNNKYLVSVTARYSSVSSGDEKFNTLAEANLRFNTAKEESQWFQISLYELLQDNPWDRLLIRRITKS